MTRLRPALLGAALIAIVAVGCLPTGTRGGSPGQGSAGPPAPATATPFVPGPPTPRPTIVPPTPTPAPTFFVYTVARGDSLNTIAHRYGTTARSIAFWNRAQHPSLDPDSSRYAPNRIEVGWILLLVPDLEVDQEELEPEPTPAPSPTPYSPYGG